MEFLRAALRSPGDEHLACRELRDGDAQGPVWKPLRSQGGDAQSGALATKYDGTRPAGYSPMKKQGATVLGIGGDNSHTGEGTFFEGCITSGLPSDAVDDQV